MNQLFFSITLFLSASLLFVVQPMVAKTLLPLYGGTPAVWTVCMLFFQALLLFAYGYAWLISRFSNPWIWRLLHLAVLLLSLTFLPLGFAPVLGQGAPDLAILRDLVSQLGLPLLVVGASAPLLQFAYSQSRSKYAHDPYFLYAASNGGSLLALLTYPVLVERFSGLNEQFYYWNIGFILYLIAVALLFFVLPYQQREKTKVHTSKLVWRQIFLWVSYSFIPCSLMLAVTFYISTDIAATPLFWVIPLALYLLSFVITFARKPLISNAWLSKNSLYFIIFPLLAFISGVNTLPAWQIILFHLSSFFILALLAHSKLVRLRPEAELLTSFYFCLALGGVLAGLFNGLFAPRYFTSAYEYPLIFALAMFCIPLPKGKGLGFLPLTLIILLVINYFLPNQGIFIWVKAHHLVENTAAFLLLIWPKNRLTLFFSVTILLFFVFSPWFQPNEILVKQRNFYGIKKVFLQNGANVLMSQNTNHGFQLEKKPSLASGSYAYYGPLFSVVETLESTHPSLEVTMIGLGTGMTACQFRSQDFIKFIDIDEQVINLAQGNQFFTYLRDCPPAISVIQGDGRLVLNKEQDNRADLLVVDAFSSDAIPTHLLTLEAFKTYQQKVKIDGAIVVHVSNRYLKLLPVLTAAGRSLDLLVLDKMVLGNYKAGQLSSEWVLLTANETLAMTLMKEKDWHFVADNKSLLWSDNYSNLVPLLKW